MDSTSLLIAGLLAASLTYFIAMMFFRIRGNVTTGLRYREAIAAELERLRMAKMLSVLGINLDQYTHQNRVLDIRQQMANCAACPNTGTCDEQIAHGTVDIDNMDYCENADVMKTMVERGN